MHKNHAHAINTVGASLVNDKLSTFVEYFSMLTYNQSYSIKNEYDSIIDATNSPGQKHTESTPVKVVGPVNYNASSDSGIVSLGMLIYNLIMTHMTQSDLIMALIIRTFTQTH